jgi:hypothetical protein
LEISGGLVNRYVLLLFPCLITVQSRSLDLPLQKEKRIQDSRPSVRAHIENRRRAWGLYDADQQLRETSAIATRNSVIFRYQQYEREIPVYAAQLTLTVTRKCVTENNGLAFPLRVDTTPTIAIADAVAAALRHTGLKSSSVDSESTLVVVPMKRFGAKKPARDSLAWQVALFGTDEQKGVIDRLVFVDAHDGTVLAAVDQLTPVQYGVAENFRFNGMYYAPIWARTIYSWNSSLTGPTDVFVQDSCYGTGVRVLDSSNMVECRTGTGGRFAIGFGNWIGDSNYQLSGNPKS